MPDTIGKINVPEIVPSGVFPIVPDYPFGRAWTPDVVVHQFGSGNTKIEQREFRGIIQEEKPLRDWIQELLMNCLGYYTFTFGKLKIGVRVNSSAVEAFTEGNVVFRSLKLAPLKPSFNHITANFADEDFQFGQVTMGSSGVSGATMTLSGCQSGSTVTDADGNYSFAVWPGGYCTVAPSKAYYIFTPGSRSVYANGAQTASFAVAATVSITNLTRPGHTTDFKVGDSWTLTINGPPNQTVAVTATHNGNPSWSSYGQTSSTGYWSLSGGMGTGEVGNWTEVWTVGPVQATPTLVFTVSP